MKKCINCGKMFENNDKRIKRCDSCRFGEDKEKKMKQIEEDLRANTERLAKIMKKYHRKALVKKIIIISILALVEILNLVLIFVK